MAETETAYVLDAQVGFLLRRATQRHLAIFAAQVPDLTPTQFAALAKLAELGPTAQTALERATAMDAATIKGVVDRLGARGLVTVTPDPGDSRKRCVAATAAGRALFKASVETAHRITAETFAPLSPADRATLLRGLERLG